MPLLDICISIFEFYIFVSFYRTIFYSNEFFDNKKNWWYLALGMACSILVTGAISIRHIMNAQPVILMLFTYSYLLCLSRLYWAKLKDRLFYAGILILLGLGSELIVGFYFIRFMNSILPEMSAVDSRYIFGSVSSKIIFFLLSRFLSIIYRKDKKTIPLTYWIILALIPAISIFELYEIVLCATDISAMISNRPIFIIPGILAVNILVFVIYDVVSNQYEKLIQRDQKLIFLENTQRRYESLIQHGQEMAALIHDSKKHLSTIASLINNNEFPTCMSYIDELGISYSRAIAFERILPENQALSIVLDEKRKEAVAHGIDVDYDISVNHGIPISDNELCMVFVNAIDNAIRACNEYHGSKRIIVRIYQTYNRLSIQLQNTSTPVNIEFNGLCKTTQKDKLRHGFGLMNIKSIVESLGGHIHLDYTDNIFSLKILLFL